MAVKNFDAGPGLARILRTGDCMIAVAHCGRELYFAVLKRDRGKLILSNPACDSNKLLAIRSIVGELEIMDDGNICLGEDGSPITLGGMISRVIPGGAKDVARRFSERVLPEQSIITHGLSVEHTEEVCKKTSMIRALVWNEDHKGSILALLEAFFRTIGQAPSSREKAYYLKVLLDEFRNFYAAKAGMLVAKEVASSLDAAATDMHLAETMDMISKFSQGQK